VLASRPLGSTILQRRVAHIFVNGVALLMELTTDETTSMTRIVNVARWTAMRLEFSWEMKSDNV
jgi:hypothetical protein